MMIFCKFCNPPLFIQSFSCHVDRCCPPDLYFIFTLINMSFQESDPYLPFLFIGVLSFFYFDGGISANCREIKKRYDPNEKKRKIWVRFLKGHIDESKYEIKIGGTTSIDVTRKGLDKE